MINSKRKAKAKGRPPVVRTVLDDIVDAIDADNRREEQERIAGRGRDCQSGASS